MEKKVGFEAGQETIYFVSLQLDLKFPGFTNLENVAVPEVVAGPEVFQAHGCRHILALVPNFLW
jgi:hypothetical protein